MSVRTDHDLSHSSKTLPKNYSSYNRPFPSYPLPLFQNESTCETIQMKMSLICMKMDMYLNLIFI